MTDSTQTPEIDPDNPPLTGREKWIPWKESFLRRVALHKARYRERQHALQAWEDDGGSVVVGHFPYGAHAHCIHNRRYLSGGGEAGCFYCLETFNAKTITKWTDNGLTALCPYCGIDAVLSSNVAPIDPLFLRQMHAYWFKQSASDEA